VMAPIDNTPAIHALFAARSVAAAATVDIAVAESARPLVDAALWRAWAARQPYGPGGRKDAERIVRQSRNKVVGQRITYRVVERLKGNSPATFNPRRQSLRSETLSARGRRPGRPRRPLPRPGGAAAAADHLPPGRARAGQPRADDVVLHAGAHRPAGRDLPDLPRRQGAAARPRGLPPRRRAGADLRLQPGGPQRRRRLARAVRTAARTGR
jgi:hypothetical protein